MFNLNAEKYPVYSQIYLFFLKKKKSEIQQIRSNWFIEFFPHLIFFFSSIIK